MTDLLGSELEDLAKTLKALNDIPNKMVSFTGDLKVYDSEGEFIGTLTQNSVVEADWVFHYSDQEEEEEEED